jgi:hypothetical protein
MGEFPRKSDGRRVFTVEFKRGVVQQLLKGEKTLAEVFKRDYVNVHELRDAESVLAQLGGWIDDYNRQAPHSARHAEPGGVPGEPRTHAPICLANWGADQPPLTARRGKKIR